jgi:hypothetical protein
MIAPSTIMIAPPNIGMPWSSWSGSAAGSRLTSSSARLWPSLEKLFSPLL